MPAREDAAEVRAWAVAEGRVPEGQAGRMPQRVYDDYDARQADPLDGVPMGGDEAAEAGAPPADPPPAAGRPRAERRPRDVPGSRPPGGWRPGWLGGSPRAKPTKKVGNARGKKSTENRPRVAVDELISGAWRGLAGVVAPMLPATGRMMKLQAPVVGVVLDPVVRGTVVDTLLQPLARTSETAEAVAVIMLPPILVGLMEADPRRAPLMMPILRGCMLRWHKVAGPSMASALKAERDFAEDWGQSVDEMIALLGMTFESAEDEDAAVYDAQQHMARGDDWPAPDADGGDGLAPPPEPFHPATAARQAAEQAPRPDAAPAPPPGLHLDPRLAPVVAQ
jgi:hypothetical protein